MKCRSLNYSASTTDFLQAGEVLSTGMERTLGRVLVHVHLVDIAAQHPGWVRERLGSSGRWHLAKSGGLLSAPSSASQDNISAEVG